MPTINYAVPQLLSAVSLVEIRVDIREPLGGINIRILVHTAFRSSDLNRIILMWWLRALYTSSRPWNQALSRYTTEVIIWLGDIRICSVTAGKASSTLCL